MVKSIRINPPELDTIGTEFNRLDVRLNSFTLESPGLITTFAPISGGFSLAMSPGVIEFNVFPYRLSTGIRIPRLDSRGEIDGYSMQLASSLVSGALNLANKQRLCFIYGVTGILYTNPWKAIVKDLDTLDADSEMVTRAAQFETDFPFQDWAGLIDGAALFVADQNKGFFNRLSVVEED